MNPDIFACDLLRFWIESQFLSSMTSLIESTHHFEKRCAELGSADNTCRALQACGITSLSRFAYAVGQPGQALDNTEWEAFVNSHFAAASIGEQSGLKRLLFEAQTLLLSDLREQVTQPEKWATRAVPDVERRKRLDGVRASISGVIVEGPMEPAHHLLEATSRMEREGQLRYIPPEKCPTRQQEIQAGKTTSARIVECDGKLTLKEEKEMGDITCGSAILVQEALRRRGIALQFAGICTYLQHERYLLKLFSHMAREPPPGCQRTSVQQIVAADKAVWTRLVEDDVQPKRASNGSYPVGEALVPALESYDITIHLLPRMRNDIPARKRNGGQQGKGDRTKWQRTEDASKGKGKGNAGKTGKGKGTSSFTSNVPNAIRVLGGSGVTPDKKRICFDRNIGGCKLNPCPKGLHVCALCFAEDHGIQDCPKRKKA